MPAQDGVGDLRHDGLLVPQDPVEQWATAMPGQFGEEILPHLIVDGAAKTVRSAKRRAFEGA